MRRLLLWTVLLACIGCSHRMATTGSAHSGDAAIADAGPYDVNTACRLFMQTGCSALVPCRAYVDPTTPSRGTITAASCQSTAASAEACARTYAAALAAASRAQVDACVSALSAATCGELCGHIPTTPPACTALSVPAGSAKVECAP